MRVPCSSVLFLVTLGLPFAAPAQGYVASAPPPAYGSGPVYPTPDPSQQFAGLSDQPSTHTSFAFDRSMMVAAQSILESNGMDPHRAALALTGVSFDTYHFQHPAFYTPEAMAALVGQYDRAGWKHLVNGNQTVVNPAQPKSAITDLWLHFSGADIDGVTVLTRASTTMNVIRLSCDLRPLDLLHLSGHFGIPKVDPSAVMVPAPPGR